MTKRRTGPVTPGVQPDLRLLRQAKALHVSYNTRLQAWVARSWPQIKRPISAKQRRSIDDFKLSVGLIKMAAPEDRVQAEIDAKYSQFLPRDILMLNSYGKYLLFSELGGKIWVGRRMLMAGVQQSLDTITSHVGAILVRTSAGWRGLDVGPDGAILSVDPVTHIPTWAAFSDTVSALLDQISSVRGSILYRGAAGWAALPPGSAGYVLTAHAAGADPTWEPGGGGGGMGLIFDQVTTAGQTLVTYSSIPATYKDLVVMVNGRSAAAVATDLLLIRFNSDAAANYDWMRVSMSGTNNTTSNTSGAGATAAGCGLLTGAAGTTNYALSSEIVIPDYAATNFFQTFQAHGGGAVAGTTANILSVLNGGIWRSTAAVNQIDLSLTTGPFVAGSRVSVYGR